MKKGIILLFCIVMGWGLLYSDYALAVERSSAACDSACQTRLKQSADDAAALKKSDDAADAKAAAATASAGDPKSKDFVGPPAPTGASATAGKDYSTNNITGQSNADLRDGNVDMYTIPLVVVAVTEMLIKIAGTIAILALVYHSIQMQINSGITGDSTGTDKAKKGMIGSLIGFVVAVSAWFLVTKALDLLSAL